MSQYKKLLLSTSAAFLISAVLSTSAMASAKFDPTDDTSLQQAAVNAKGAASSQHQWEEFVKTLTADSRSNAAYKNGKGVSKANYENSIRRLFVEFTKSLPLGKLAQPIVDAMTGLPEGINKVKLVDILQNMKFPKKEVENKNVTIADKNALKAKNNNEINKLIKLASAANNVKLLNNNAALELANAETDSALLTKNQIADYINAFDFSSLDDTQITAIKELKKAFKVSTDDIQRNATLAELKNLTIFKEKYDFAVTVKDNIAKAAAAKRVTDVLESKINTVYKKFLTDVTGSDNAKGNPELLNLKDKAVAAYNFISNVTDKETFVNEVDILLSKKDNGSKTRGERLYVLLKKIHSVKPMNFEKEFMPAVDAIMYLNSFAKENKINITKQELNNYKDKVLRNIKFSNTMYKLFVEKAEIETKALYDCIVEDSENFTDEGEFKSLENFEDVKTYVAEPILELVEVLNQKSSSSSSSSADTSKSDEETVNLSKSPFNETEKFEAMQLELEEKQNELLEAQLQIKNANIKVLNLKTKLIENETAGIKSNSNTNDMGLLGFNTTSKPTTSKPTTSKPTTSKPTTKIEAKKQLITEEEADKKRRDEAEQKREAEAAQKRRAETEAEQKREAEAKDKKKREAEQKSKAEAEAKQKREAEVIIF